MDSFRNIDAEMSVIGACLLDQENAIPKASRLFREDFTDNRHQLIWPAILELSNKNEPVDLTTLSARLRQQGRLRDCGGDSYLATLYDHVPIAANAGYYVKLVKDCSDRRNLARAGQEIASEAATAESPTHARDRAEALIFGLRSTSNGTKEALPIADLTGPALKRLEMVAEQDGRLLGVPTGFPSLDKMTCGLQPADLVIVAGRPSMGKTALALNIAETAAASGYRTLIFSLEMSKELLVNRLISSKAGIDANRLRSGQLNDGDWGSTMAAAGAINELPLVVDDRPDITPMDIRATARREHQRNKLGLIVIDYLGLIRPTQRLQVREREVAEISRSLKALAKELNVPVVVLAQLNRGGEKDGSPRRPRPSDLRESGSLEQDADLIIFPWREAAYCEDCKKLNSDCGKGHYYLAEIIIGKQRNGPTGTIQAAWLGKFTRFEPI